jgi:hypothetical protein
MQAWDWVVAVLATGQRQNQLLGLMMTQHPA